MPGIERPGLPRTHLARNVVHDAERPAGVFVVSTVAVDEVNTTVVSASGLLAAHVHLTSDGERAMVVTELTDAASHEATTPGGVGFKRYTLYHACADDRR
ncbi:hypothetical protein [Streptomyces olivaceiscleroticus]|uniref:Uncharacterized protein n=1 Tax=Streptomyces olivaceiscleroticus TaxID=68245 RepID=A0ABP3JDL5_9ACTN